MCFFFSSRRRHTRYIGDWSSDVCSSDLATEFEVPGIVSLPSDGRKVTVSLAKLSLPAKMRLRVVPRLDQAAIVTAEAKRPEGVWLPGEIQLQRDGKLVGSTHWDPQTASGLVL